MKCVCGYVEPEGYWKKTEVFWQSGKNKGKLKRVDEDWIEPEEEDKFIQIKIERDFRFVREADYYGPVGVYLYACPKCKTVRMAD